MEILIQMSKYAMSGLIDVVITSMVSAFLTNSMHTIFEISSSDAYDVFIGASTAEITKLD